MKKLKKTKNLFGKLICLALSAILAAAAMPLSGSADVPANGEVPSDDVPYGLSYRFVTFDTIEITAYEGYESELTVPSYIDGFKVVGIRDFHTVYQYGNHSPGLKKVILPETVTYIADEAFEDGYYTKVHSALEEIVLPESLKTIGEYAFSGCGALKSIHFPAGLEQIAKGAFESCISLENVTFGGDNTYIHPNAFGAVNSSFSEGFAKYINDLYNDWLWDDSTSDFFIWKNILLAYKGESKTPVIPSGVTAIGKNIFRGCEITGVTIPEGVKYIGQYAFWECKELKSVSFPKTLEQIDGTAFSDCEKLETVNFNEGLKIIGDNAFADCTALTSALLPEGLEELGECAFEYCENISQVNIPSSVVKADNVFYDSKWYNALPEDYELYYGSVFLGIIDNDYSNYPEELTIRPGTKTVYLEYYCDGLKKLNLPDGLETLIINGGDSLTELNVPESVNYIEVKKLYNLVSAKLPQTCTVADASFAYLKKLKTVNIPKGNPYLNAFGGCDALENITIPDDVLELGAIGGENLRTINLGNIRVLGEGALSSSNLLTEVTLPDSLVAIEGGAFSGCTALKTVKGGKNVKTLGYGAFSGCGSLNDLGELEKSVTWTEHDSLAATGWYYNQPDGPVYFGKVAYCYKGKVPENTTLVIKEGTVAVAGAYITDQMEMTPHNMANFETPGLVGVVLPESCRLVDYYAFWGCEKLTSIDLGGAVIIDTMAFNNHGCKTINLPDSVRYIGDNAFSSGALEAAHLNNGLRYLENGAFFTYGKGKGMTVPESVTFIGSQAIGYYPPDPDDPFGGILTIDGFIITGAKGSEAESYATLNGFAFREGDESACTSHSFVSDTLSPTCVSEGYTLKTCTICGYTEISDRKGATGQHKEVSDASLEASCCSKGHTGGSHCASCGKVMSQASFTPALGHDWVISRLDDPSYVGYGVFDYVHYCRRCELRIYVNSAAPSSYYGDVDNNGKIEASDALMALQAYVKTRTLTDDQFTRADIDADGAITVTDALYILQFSVGLRASFPADQM